MILKDADILFTIAEYWLIPRILNLNTLPGSYRLNEPLWHLHREEMATLLHALPTFQVVDQFDPAARRQGRQCIAGAGSKSSRRFAAGAGRQNAESIFYHARVITNRTGKTVIHQVDQEIGNQFVEAEYLFQAALTQIRPVMEAFNYPRRLTEWIIRRCQNDGVGLEHVHGGIATVHPTSTIALSLPSLFLVVLWRSHRTESQHIEMNRFYAGSMIQTQPGRHNSPPITALRPIPFVAQHLIHQFVPQSGSLTLGNQAARLAAETKARQARDHQIISLFYVATVA